MGWADAKRGAGCALVCATALLLPVAQAVAEDACGKADFEAVVEEAATGLRDLNTENKPKFQDKLRQLKTKRAWTHDQFMREAAPFVRDDKIGEYDTSIEELLGAIATMGQEGAAAQKPDCALLVELRARMKVLVETQTAKWIYMFGKIDAELVK